MSIRPRNIIVGTILALTAATTAAVGIAQAQPAESTQTCGFPTSGKMQTSLVAPHGAPAQVKSQLVKKASITDDPAAQTANVTIGLSIYYCPGGGRAEQVYAWHFVNDGSAYGNWVECGKDECGRIAPKGTNALFYAPADGEALVYGSYAYANHTNSVTISGVWKGQPLPRKSDTTWLGRTRHMRVAYLGVGAHSNAFDTPTYGGGK